MGSVPIPADATDQPEQKTVPIPSDASDVQGQMTNDVGNPVVVPLPGESFENTMKRARDRFQSLSSEEQQQEIARETRPKDLAIKTGAALGGAATAGIAGPALLAIPGEAASAALTRLLPALTRGVVAVGDWAEANPTAAKMILEGIKLTTYGSILFRGLKKAIDIGANE